MLKKLHGRLTCAGELNVDGDTMFGVFVECTRADLRDNLPLLYSDVEVCAAEKNIVVENLS